MRPEGSPEAPAPDFFRTSLAALELLADAAAGSPLLVVAENAQWLDPSTADVLAFVARRLEFEPIVLLAAIRDGYGQPGGRGPGARAHIDYREVASIESIC